jgi:2-methylcitrate dehydratase PrpD
VADTTLVQQLAGFVADASYASLPDDVAASAPERVLDILGLCLAAVELDTSAAALGWVADSGGHPEATVIGARRRAPSAQAAFANGVLAHSLDYDDTHLPSVLHPSASVVPAALAAAQCAGSSGPALLAAVAAGVEVCVRLGMAGFDREAGQSLFFERGQHATSICGAIGSAAAAAALLGLDEAGIADAMGLAVSMTGGVIEANRTGGTVKRLHCGWAAHAGVSAAQLAARGFTGPPTVLEGRFGFYEAFLSGRFEPAEITLGLGQEWALPGIHYKPYPANHFTHAVADAALAFRASGLHPALVAAVEVGVAAPTVRTIGEPLDQKRRPPTGYAAKFSAPYVFAAALLGGTGLGLGHEDFSDVLVGDPARMRLMDLVTVVPSAECDALYPHALPAVVRVTCTDGAVLEQKVLVNRGGPGRPLTPDELATKFLENATRVLCPETALRLADDVARLPEIARAGDALLALEETR